MNENMNMYENKKSNKGLVFALIFVILIALCLGGYIVYDKVIASDSDQKEVDNTKTEEQKETNKELDVTSSEVTDLMDKISISDMSMDLVGYFYSSDKITVDTMDNNIKLVIGLQTSYKKNEALTELTKEQMATNIKSVFGKNTTYTDKDVTGGACYGSSAKYNSSSNTYTLDGGCGGTGPERAYYEKVTKAIKTSNTIEVYQQAIYTVPDENGDMNDFDNISVTIYTPDKKTKIATSTVGEVDNKKEALIDTYKDTLPTYKFTFNKEDNNYVFYSVEKVV